MKVLITGGAGFIGSHVAKALVARGDEVVLFDDFNELLYPASLKRARVAEFLGDAAPELVEASLLDQDALSKAVTKDIDVVIHFGALANPRVSLDKEDEYTDVNVTGTLNVLKAATNAGVGKVIFAGSSSVYNDEQTPFKESSYPLKPRSPYGASKAAAEVYCGMWHDLHQLPITVLRFFSVYGPWGRPDMAPFIFAEKILGGETIEVSRDKRQRDFTCIDDVVPAVLAATEADLGFEVINVGRGEPVHLSDLIMAIESAAGIEARITERETPPGEMRVTYADVSKAKKLLEYQPSISVQDGVKPMVAWIRDWWLNNAKSK